MLLLTLLIHLGVIWFARMGFGLSLMAGWVFFLFPHVLITTYLGIITMRFPVPW